MSIISSNIDLGLQQELALYLLALETVDPGADELGYDLGVSGDTSESLLGSVGQAPELGNSDQDVTGLINIDMDLQMQAQLHASGYQYDEIFNPTELALRSQEQTIAFRLPNNELLAYMAPILA